MNKILRYFILILATLFFVNIVLVPIFEPMIVYQVKKEMMAYPDSYGLRYEDVYLATRDGKKINGWYVKNDRSKKVIIYLKGNAENMSFDLSMATLRFLHSIPANVMMIDYHGYGKSEGRPSEKNLYLDAEAAYDHLKEKKGYDPRDIFLVGNSLGGAVAIELALRREVGGVVLLRTFTSMAEMAGNRNPLYRFPVIWIRNVYDSKEKIKRLKVPVIIAHAKNDRIIPYRMSIELYKSAPEPKKLFIFEKGGHDDVFTDPEYVRSLKELLK